MHTITLQLTDDEYLALKRHADAERRSVEQMAEYIVAKAQPQPQAVPIYVYPQVYPAPQVPARPNWWYYTNSGGTVNGLGLQSQITNGSTIHALNASGE